MMIEPAIGTRVSRSGTLQLQAPVGQVFPLFDPVNESKWSHGWKIQIVFSEQAEIGAGTVFKTQGKSGDESIWLISRYAKEKYEISYIMVDPDSRLTQIDIACIPSDQKRATANVTYTVTALNERGAKFVGEFTSDHYAREMAAWQRAINHFLKHGSVLTAHT